MIIWKSHIRPNSIVALFTENEAAIMGIEVNAQIMKSLPANEFVTFADKTITKLQEGLFDDDYPDCEPLQLWTELRDELESLTKEVVA